MTDQTAEQRMAEVLAAHRLYGDLEHFDDLECGCGATPPEEAGEEDFGEFLWHEAHQAAALVAAGFGDVRQAGAEALREAADEFKQGRWITVVPRWLRDRADEIEGAA